jgi:tetratricopeptide (TPR) repeat protein
LRNTIAWSYELLDPNSALVFRRAGVFAGGFSLAALAAVTNGVNSDPLALTEELVDASLITVGPDADREPRLGMLATIREFALERLEFEDSIEDARRRHAEYYLSLAEEARSQLDGPRHLSALDRLNTEHDNLRAALHWSLETRASEPAAQAERVVMGTRLVEALSLFWYQHGHPTEGRRGLQRAMDNLSADGGESLARVAHGLGVLLDQLGHAGEARDLFERSLAIWSDLGDRQQQAKELNSLGIVFRHLDEPDTARVMYERAIAINRTIPDSPLLATNLTNLAQLESAVGDLERAGEVLQEALALDLEHEDVFGVAVDRHSLALLALRTGRPAEARDLLCELFDYVVSSGSTSMFINALELAVAIMAALGESVRAARLLGAAEAIRRESGMLISGHEAHLLDTYVSKARMAMSPREWESEVAIGRACTESEALALLLSLGETSGEPSPGQAVER